ncbi:MAG: hypothetical protein JWP00_3128 [Chloroflexi bacterium]|nr:hypothetical protein [Chloroflexota bacterium]
MNVRETRASPARAWDRLPPGFWQGFLSGAFALAIIGGLLAFLLSPEILKHRSPFPLEEAIGQSRIDAAIDGSYKDRANPVAATPENIAAGRTIYNSNCAFCHGVTGQGEAQIGQNMFPKAANLREPETANKTDGQLFWILENGLSFVGMPAFKSSLSQDDLWKATLYIRQLQKGTAAAAPAATAGSAASATVSPAGTTAAAAPTSTTAAQAYAPTTAAARTSVATQAAPANTTAAAAANSGDLAKGVALFQQQGCTGCHGGDKATGGVGPALNNIQYPFAGLLKQVRSGGGVMPPYPAASLPDSDVMLIYNYLKSLQK